MTIPNLVTALRIIMAPIFIIFLISDELTSALIVFLACVVSDGVDGMIARLFDQKSKLGSYLDPLADKLLLVTAFVVLAARGFLPAWLTVMVISRDVLILLGVLVLFLIGFYLNIKPSVLSKLNTCLQFTTVISVLSKDYLPFPGVFYSYLFYVTALFTISSGLDYMRYGFKIVGEGPANNRGRNRN
jgi:cardiolipin synthase